MNNLIYFLFYCLCISVPETLVSGHTCTGEEKKIKDKAREELIESSSSDEAILKSYFCDQFCTSCMGYVLYGSKPLNLDNNSDEESSCIGTERHKETCETLEVSHIWNDLDQSKRQTDYILILSNSHAHGNVTLVINRKAFLEVVNKNLALFRSKLGIHITAESLLQKLLDPNVDVCTLFKGNTALLGILLGYGTENSIAYERAMNILKPIVSQSQLSPPCRADLPPANPNDTIKKVTNSAPDNDEMTILINSMATPTNTYENGSTKIPFSYLKDSEESKTLLQMYVNAQAAVEKAISSGSSYEEILLKFNCPHLERKKNPYSLIDPKIASKLPTLVAKSIFEHMAAVELGSDFGSEETSYIDYFISGMKEAEKAATADIPESYNDSLFFDAYQILLSTPSQIKSNRDISNKFFKSFSNQPDITWIEPAKICYKIIKQGDGEILNNKAKTVSMQYLIKDIEGKILSGSLTLAPNSTFEVSKLIPALAHAMQGMKKNEIREVFIHQDFAYGNSAAYGDGKALSIQVELTGIECIQEELKLDDLIPIDLARLYDNSQGNKNISKIELELLRKRYMMLCGFRTWMHYKKASQFFTLSDILRAMDKIQSSEKSELQLSKFDKRVLRRLDLFLYST